MNALIYWGKTPTSIFLIPIFIIIILNSLGHELGHVSNSRNLKYFKIIVNLEEIKPLKIFIKISLNFF